MSQLALRGTEITHENPGEGRGTMDVTQTVEDELQYIHQGQDAARDALKETARVRLEQDESRIADVRNDLEDVYDDPPALGEELDILAGEGTQAGKAKVRVERAQRLYEEADAAIGAGDLVQAKAKTKAARQMVDAARSSIGE